MNDIATGSEIRANVCRKLRSLRQDVVALGYRWELSGKFLAVIDDLLSDCDNRAISAEVLAGLAVAPLSFQPAVREADDVRRAQ